ncbi:MAG: MFS transporter [Gammaproteobacteria bacterium]|nr:MFS transporter [Gammaproteobacteria bacterium]
MISAGLAGMTAALVLVTVAADRIGRRRTLVALAVLGGLGGLATVGLSSVAAVAVVAFLGMLNGQGRDRGAALVVEQAVLPATGTEQERTRIFAWYNVLQDVGHALGALLGALPTLLHEWGGIEDLAGMRATILLYGGLLLCTALLSARLSPAIETVGSTEGRPQLSPESRRRLARISALFAIDSLAGGFLGSALVAYFFSERFGADAATIAALFVGARALNAVSHLGAAWLARRIGLVNTMVFTHIPSSLLLATVAIAPDFTTAAIFFLLREGLVEMDVPTRQSYVMAMVRPEERTFASGLTHLVRVGGWAVAPSFAGLFMQSLALGAPLVVGAALKIAYDLLLYVSFRGIQPPEEAGR